MIKRQPPISIHALCEEGDGASVILSHFAVDFYPRPLRGGRRRIWLWNWLTWIFLSTPSARRATSLGVHKHAVPVISIHALCEEGDRITSLMGYAFLIFLSTPSARRATFKVFDKIHHGVISIHALCEEGDFLHWSVWSRALYFYPRPLRGGRRSTSTFWDAPMYFYPRPLRGGRRLLWDYYNLQDLFLSTPSARRATQQLRRPLQSVPISIHALCEEGDYHTRQRLPVPGHFYPRPLRGGRRAYPS